MRNGGLEMENYNYLDTQDFEDEVDFALFIIKYFKNDYLVIRDFLFKDSPWDLMIQWEITVTHPEFIEYDTYDERGRKYFSADELVKRKIHLISIIYSTYYNCVLSALPKDDDELVEAPIIDFYMYNLVSSTQFQANLMLKNDLFAIKILKFLLINK